MGSGGMSAFKSSSIGSGGLGDCMSISSRGSPFSFSSPADAIVDSTPFPSASDVVRENDLERGIVDGEGTLPFDSEVDGGIGGKNGWRGAASKIFSV